MVKALFALGRLFVTVPFFEFLGVGLLGAGAWVLAGVGWALVVGGGLAMVKSLDLALTPKGK